MRGTFVADNRVAVNVEQKPVVAGQTRTCISRVSMDNHVTPAMCTCDSTFIGTDTRQPSDDRRPF